MTEQQQILPFRQWRISRHWGTLLAVVNQWAGGLSGWYDERWHIYRLKDRILSRHGVPDGTDLQILTLHCRACHGSGYHGPPWRRDGCWTCGATGLYAHDYITLQRFRLGGRIFHAPIGTRIRVFGDGRDEVEPPETDRHREIIRGHIRHDAAFGRRWRWASLMLLTLRFHPAKAPAMLHLWAHVRWVDYARSRHFMRSAWRIRFARLRRGLPVNWFGSNEDPTVPF